MELEKNISKLPDGWKIVSIGNHFKFKNGLNKAKKFFGEGTPIVNYMDVFPYPARYSKDIEGKVTLTNDEIRAFEVRKGDVLFTRTSETIEEIGLCTTIMDDVKNTVFSGFLLRARPITNFFHLDFKKYCFRSSIVRKQIISTSSQTTRALTNGKLLSKVKLPIPIDPLEQESIAKSISDFEKLIESLDKLIIKKKNIKQGTMQELLTGNKRLEGFNEEWISIPLSQCGIITMGQSPEGDSYNSDGKGTPLLNGAMDLKEKGILITQHTTKPTRLSKEGDLLFCIRATIGNLQVSDGVYCLGRGVASLTVRKEHSEKFVQYQLQQLFESMRNQSEGGVIKGLRKDDLGKFKIKIPKNKKEQYMISQILFSMDSEINELEKQLNKYINIKQGMMEKLLTGEIRLV